MSETSLRGRILSVIREVDTVTFAELRNRFDEFRNGLATYCLPGNIVLWSGMTDEAVRAFDDLKFDKLIVPVPTSPWTYSYDGHGLTLPNREARKGLQKSALAAGCLAAV